MLLERYIFVRTYRVAHTYVPMLIVNLVILHFKLYYRVSDFSLPSNIQNIIIVDGSYALYFWEVFESTEIRGVVVTLSSLNYVRM